MWIKYFIPEDGDDAQHPNVFRVSQNADITLSHVKQAFPIPGQYHFRFLKAIGSNTVWMDITDPSSPIPTYQGSILLKASRVAAANVSSSEPTASKPATSAPAEKSAPPVPKPPRPQPQHQPSEKLLSFNDDDGHVGTAATPTGSGAAASAAAAASSASAGANASAGSASPASFFDDSADLLGMTAPTTAASNVSTPANGSNDLFGLETLQPTGSMGRPAMSGPMGTSRTASPMGGMPAQSYSAMRPNAMSGGPAMGGGPMGGGSAMGGGPMGGGPMGGVRPAQPAAQSKPGAYDPFNDIGMGMGNGASRGFPQGQYSQSRR